LLKNFDIHAIRRKVLIYDEYLCRYHETFSFLEFLVKLLKIIFLFSSINIFCSCIEVFRSSSLTNISSISSSIIGHSSGGNFNQDGPSHHLDSKNFCASQPREGRSAGFNFPGTYLQSLGLVSFLISCTRFHTKTVHCFSRRIQDKTVVESLQKYLLICL